MDNKEMLKFYGKIKQISDKLCIEGKKHQHTNKCFNDGRNKMLSELLKMHKDDLDRYKNHPEHHAMYKIEWGIYYARQIRDCFINREPRISDKDISAGWTKHWPEKLISHCNIQLLHDIDEMTDFFQSIDQANELDWESDETSVRRCLFNAFKPVTNGENVTRNSWRKQNTDVFVLEQDPESNDKVQSDVQEKEKLKDEDKYDHLQLLKAASVRLRRKSTGCILKESSQTTKATSRQSPHLRSSISVIDLGTDEETDCLAEKVTPSVKKTRTSASKRTSRPMSPSYSSGLSSSDDSPPISHKVSNHLATKLDNTSNGLLPNVCSDVMIVDDSPQIYGPDELYQDSCNNETSTSKTSFDDSANIKRHSLIPMEREVISSVNPIEPPKNTSNEKGCDLELDSSGLFYRKANRSKPSETLRIFGAGSKSTLAEDRLNEKTVMNKKVGMAPIAIIDAPKKNDQRIVDESDSSGVFSETSKRSRSSDEHQFFGAASKSGLTEQQSNTLPYARKVSMESRHEKRALGIDAPKKSGQRMVDDQPNSSEMYSAMNNKRSKPSDEQQYSSASPKAVLTEQQSSNVHGAKTTSTNKKIEKMVVSVEGEPKKNIQRIIDDETVENQQPTDRKMFTNQPSPSCSMPKPFKSIKVEEKVHSNEEIKGLIESDDETETNLGEQWAMKKIKFYLNQLDLSHLSDFDKEALLDESETLYLTLLESSELDDETFLGAFVEHFLNKRVKKSDEDSDDDCQIVE